MGRCTLPIRVSTAKLCVDTLCDSAVLTLFNHDVTVHSYKQRACRTLLIFLSITLAALVPASASETEDGEWQAIPSAGSSSYLVPVNATLSTEDGEWKAVGTASPGRSFTQIPQKKDRATALPLITEYEEKGSVSDLTITNRTDAELLSALNTQDSIDSLPVTNLDMFVGQLRVLGRVDVTRVAIGNGGIIRAEVLKTGELLVIGQEEGSTSLRLWNKDSTQTAFNIRVGASDPETRIRMERMVRMKVRMVDFSKRALTSLGINWSTDTAGPTFAAAGDAIGNNLFRPPSGDAFGALPNQVAPFSTYFGIASDITSRINLLSNNNDAVTLAEPVLSAVNGGQASFLAGGEVPYSTIGANGLRTTEFKEYGVRLQVAPRIDSSDNIRTFIETEISSLDQGVSVNGAPGLKVRRAQTEVNVRSGQTIVISGLLAVDRSDTVQEVPGLGRIPLLGRLFRSNAKDNEQRELVIFLTPEVVEPFQEDITLANQALFDKTSQTLNAVQSAAPLME